VNQILITGDERVTEKVKKQKDVLPINGIVVFYAISIIILGICLISGSVYAKGKINETVEASIRPTIYVERNEDDKTLQIAVTHIRGIKNITYQWNDDEIVMVDTQNKKEINKTIDLIGGKNTIKIIATEENGQTSTLEKTFIVGNIPEIKLEAVANGVKLIVKSDVEIDYLEYSWDDGEKQKIDVGVKEYEGIINTPKGQHTLKIEVVDINGMKANKTQVVVGDTEPIVNVKPQLVNGKVAFVIDAEDDEKITTIELTHNGGEKEVINVNEKTYHKEIIMTEGETNTLIITATNINGLPKTRRVKFDNK
jgi:hypothetical protein